MWIMKQRVLGMSVPSSESDICEELFPVLFGLGIDKHFDLPSLVIFVIRRERLQIIKEHTNWQSCLLPLVGYKQY